MKQARSLPLVDKGVDDPFVQIADSDASSRDPPAAPFQSQSPTCTLYM